MDYVRFGRTELNVSVMGLGCGGPSRIGLNADKSDVESVNIIRGAIDAGVNFIDTAEVYRTEGLIGKALNGVDRDKIVISSKKNYRGEISPALLREGLEASLKRLNTDYIDIYNLHGVSPDDYVQLRDEILPTFEALRQEGKIRFVGVSEMFGEDGTHEMLRQSLADDVWDVVMVGFNIINQTARDILELTQEKDIAVQIMYAVRRALSQPDKLIESMQTLVDAGQLSPEDIDLQNPLGFVLEESDATSVVDAAYRFCRYEPGVHVVLSGTGNLEHLQSNIDSLNRDPLPDALVEKLRHIFRHATVVNGN
jgi:aryl-alcohol dehydrogenase-like predicted oxidoreductase